MKMFIIINLLKGLIIDEIKNYDSLDYFLNNIF